MSDLRNAEYRVVWKREGCAQKRERLKTIEGAVRQSA